MATLSVPSPTRKYAVAGAVLVIVPLAVVAYRFASRGSLPAPPPIAKQAPLVRMDVEVTSPTPGAIVKIAGEAHPVPFSGDVAGGTSLVVVELTAPEHEGRTFRIVFDRPRRLAFALPSGAGMVEATPEEHEHAVATDDQVLVTRPNNVASATAIVARHEVKALATGSASGTASAVASVNVPSAPTVTAEPPATAAAVVPPPTAAAVAATVVAPSKTAPTAPAVQAGTVDPKAVRATVRAHASEVQTCYDRAKLDVPDLKGRLTVEASVNGAGRVQSARVVESDVRSSRLEVCIVSAFQGWSFPAPAGGVPGSVKYTFVFQD